jgi:hypothetical protein
VKAEWRLATRRSMKALLEFLRFVPREERAGIRLEDWPRWRVEPVKDVARFLRALCDLFPSGSILYLEGGSPPPAVRALLERRRATEPRRVEMGTIWPRPAQFHLPMTRENLHTLADLAEGCAAPEIAIHVHVYHRGMVLLEWYDAFYGDPFYVSRHVAESTVQRLCAELGTEYRMVASEADLR